jgi:NAD(P)-dependent dehydrogenase (short-subunit alcohol dehydrogenase family)
MEHFKEKVALVTGGNSGIGFATAKELVANGAKVIITGRRKEAIEQAASEIGAFPIVADQEDLSAIDLLAEGISKQFGKIDILFINAGITGLNNLIAQADVSDFDKVMGINFRGSYFTLSKLIPLLNDGASVVFLSSIAATTHTPKSSVYQASKAAISSIAKTAAAELAGRKIRVNTVSPGPTRTDVLNKTYDDLAAQAIWENLANSLPLKKIGLPENVAKLVVYLCKEEASFITGADFVLDGGMTL